MPASYAGEVTGWQCGWPNNASLEAAVARIEGAPPAKTRWHESRAARPERAAACGSGAVHDDDGSASEDDSSDGGEETAADAATAARLAAPHLPASLHVLNDAQVRVLASEVEESKEAALLCALLRLRCARRRKHGAPRVLRIVETAHALLRDARARGELWSGQALAWLAAVMRTHKDKDVLKAAYGLFVDCARLPDAHAAIRLDWRLADAMPALLEHTSLPPVQRAQLLWALVQLSQHEVNRVELRTRADATAVALVRTVNGAVYAREDDGGSTTAAIVQYRAAAALAWLCQDAVCRSAVARAGAVGVLLPLLRADRAHSRAWWGPQLHAPALHALAALAADAVAWPDDTVGRAVALAIDVLRHPFSTAGGVTVASLVVVAAVQLLSALLASHDVLDANIVAAVGVLVDLVDGICQPGVHLSWPPAEEAPQYGPPASPCWASAWYTRDHEDAGTPAEAARTRAVRDPATAASCAMAEAACAALVRLEAPLPAATLVRVLQRFGGHVGVVVHAGALVSLAAELGVHDLALMMERLYKVLVAQRPAPRSPFADEDHVERVQSAISSAVAALARV